MAHSHAHACVRAFTRKCEPEPESDAAWREAWCVGSEVVEVLMALLGALVALERARRRGPSGSPEVMGTATPYVGRRAKI